jgi:diguanylate cyclase (GGDEF)-like protein
MDHYQMEKRYFHKSGQIVDVLLSVSGVHDAEGNVVHFVSQIEDITARKNERERIRQLAFYDMLTGLPNRRLFDERISHAILTARRNKQMLAMMFIDVDHFKHINDTYGHDIGDDVIKGVAERMQAVLRDSDTLARFGGDEFVVLLSDVPGGDAALKVAENLRQPFIENLPVAGNNIRITLSIGVAIWSPENNDTVASLMKKADVALYDVKGRGRNGVALYQSSDA